MFTNDMFAAEVDDKQSKEIFLDENDFYVGFLDGDSMKLCLLITHTFINHGHKFCNIRKRKTWKECVDNDMKVLGLQFYILNERYSGMCGGTSYYGQMSNPSVAWKKWTFLKWMIMMMMMMGGL